MTPLTSQRSAAGDLLFDTSPCTWFDSCELLAVDGESGERRTGTGESLLLLLGGTFDLFAGGGSWLRRGLRPQPTDAGRPVALFLPPNTPWQARAGRGSLLRVGSRQPELPPPAAEEPPATRKKPLLQISGSGKAFDSATQSWKPKEAFLESPEALLPRRFARLPAGDAVVERIADADYKALSLRLDEVVLGAGQVLQAPDPGAPAAEETLLVVNPAAGASLHLGDRQIDAATALWLPGSLLPELRAENGACHLTIAYAGSKLPSTT